MVPTVTVLAVMKARLVGATKGHALLKKKADALSLRFRMILKNIVNAKEEMGKLMKESFFALAQAKYVAGEFRHTLLDSVDQVRDLPRRATQREGGRSMGGCTSCGRRLRRLGRCVVGRLARCRRRVSLLPAGVGAHQGDAGQRRRSQAAQV